MIMTHGMPNTNENGELILRVPNGDYTIESFYDGSNDYPINRIVTANNESPDNMGH